MNKTQNIVNTDYLQKKKSIPLALLSCLSYNKLFANKIEKKTMNFSILLMLYMYLQLDVK